MMVVKEQLKRFQRYRWESNLGPPRHRPDPLTTELRGVLVVQCLEHPTGVTEMVSSFYCLSFHLNAHGEFSFVADFKQMRRRQPSGIL